MDNVQLISEAQTMSHLSDNGSALTTPLNRTRGGIPLGGALLPVKGCGCPAPAPEQIRPVTQGTHASLPQPTYRSVGALLCAVCALTSAVGKGVSNHRMFSAKLNLVLFLI